MSRVRRSLVAVVVPAVFLAFLGGYVWRERDQLEPLFDAPIHQAFAIAGLVAFAHFLNSTEFWLLYRAQGVRTGIIENWMLFIGANLGNYLPGQVGTLYRVRYMKSVHGVSYTATAAIYGSNLIITLAGAAFAGLAGVAGHALVSGGIAVMVGVGYSILLVAAVAVLVVPLPGFLQRSGRVLRVWRAFREGFDATRRSPRLTVTIVAIESVKYAVTALRFLLAFRLLGFSESYWFFLALAPAAGIAAFISFTPGALGIREAFITGTAVALGSPLATGVLASTADRAIMLMTSIVLGGLGLALTYPTLTRSELGSEGPPSRQE